MAPATEDLLAGVRRLCLALPEVTEGLTHGGETWFVRRRSFAKFVDPKNTASTSGTSRSGPPLRPAPATSSSRKMQSASSSRVSAAATGWGCDSICHRTA